MGAAIAPENVTGLLDFMQKTQATVLWEIGPAMLIMIWVLTFAGLSTHWDSIRAASGAFFITMIVSIFLAATGVINGLWVLAPVFGLGLCFWALHNYDA